MKRLTLIFAIINTLFLLYCVLALVIGFEIVGLFLTVASIAFDVFLIFLIVSLFEKKRSFINIVLIVLSMLIFVATFLGFVYDGVVSYINGSFHEIVPSFVVAVYIVFSLYSWVMVLYLDKEKRK